MSEERDRKIFANLEIISSLTPGYTLSPSTMTIVNHNSWSGTLWRTYAREDRQKTLSHIKGIFVEAINLLKINYTQELVNSIGSSLRGFLSLKDTYKGDYYIIGEITNSHNTIARELYSQSILDQQDVIIDMNCEMGEKNPQEGHYYIYPRDVVETPDRTNDQEATPSYFGQGGVIFSNEGLTLTPSTDKQEETSTKITFNGPLEYTIENLSVVPPLYREERF